ncbi:MAG: heavy metal-associated domain-containing protein [Flavobacteriales bacterium]|jgi:copper chaperone CopZ|nr:MAG: heavy metal-associated domain-containing protein [Flavobacteriales bacterium]
MRTIVTALLIGCWISLAAQKAPAHLDIVSSTVCDMCVQTIEGELIYEKGVKKVVVDLASSTVHIEYDARKNSPAGLRAALVKLGYSADGVPGDPKAFAKLPDCCQKEGCGKLPETKP